MIVCYSDHVYLFNAKFSSYTSQFLPININSARITICSKERLIQLQQIAKEHGYENTHDDILVEMVEIGKHLRMLKATCPYESKQGQASDVTRTLKQIDENVSFHWSPCAVIVLILTVFLFTLLR